MIKKLFATLLTLILLSPEVLSAQSKTTHLAAVGPVAPSTVSTPAQTTTGTQHTPATRSQPAARRRSLEREATTRQRAGISKKEIAFMAAIAGTSVGIDALAAGAKGVAIGGIVGGWGAHLGHRLWGWIH